LTPPDVEIAFGVAIAVAAGARCVPVNVIICVMLVAGEVIGLRIASDGIVAVVVVVLMMKSPSCHRMETLAAFTDIPNTAKTRVELFLLSIDVTIKMLLA
jgi:hypothetical protein